MKHLLPVLDAAAAVLGLSVGWLAFRAWSRPRARRSVSLSEQVFDRMGMGREQRRPPDHRRSMRSHPGSAEVSGDE